MSKPNYIVHFNDVSWSYYGQLNIHHIENKHGVRVYYEKTTKHSPPREMYQLAFPGEDGPVHVYVVQETIDGTVHYRCTPVNKRTDKLPAHMGDFKGNLRDIRAFRSKNAGNGDLSQ